MVRAVAVGVKVTVRVVVVVRGSPLKEAFAVSTKSER